jgi:Tfp pilus assembly protein PilO
MDKYIKKYQAIILPLVSILIGVGIIGLIVVRQAMEIPKTNTQINQLKAKDALLQQKVQDLSSIDIDTYRQYFDTTLMAIPSEKDLPGVFGQLLIVLHNNGLFLDDINFGSAGTTAPNTKLEEISLKLNISGPQTGIQMLMDKIKEMPRIMKINTIDISNVQLGKISVSISVTAYYQGLPASVSEANVEQPVPHLSDPDKQILDKIRAYLNNIPTGSDEPTGPVGKINPFD